MPEPEPLAALPPGKAERAAASPAGLTLLWADPAGLLHPAIARAARREAARLLAGLGFPVTWESAKDSWESSLEPDAHVAVILLPRDPSPGGRRRSRLGATLKGDRPPYRAWLFFASVRRALGHRDHGAAPLRPAEGREVAIALGRAAAHEVVHVLAPAHPHAEDGLMRTVLTRHSLLSAGVALDAACACAAAAGFARLDPGRGPAAVLD